MNDPRLPTLVLLPGTDGTGDLFAPFIAAMGPGCKVLCVRYPDDAAMGYAELEALVRSQLPHGSHYVVLGESFSGPIAASLSTAPPPGLMGIVLCCTFVRNPRPQLAVFGGLLKFAPLKAVPVAAVSPVLLGRYSTPALRAALAAALAQVQTATLQARLRAVMGVDVRARLAEAQLPVLYLQARQDHLVPASAAAEVQACLPSVKVEPLAGPHLLLQANPGPAAAAVSQFMLSLIE